MMAQHFRCRAGIFDGSIETSSRGRGSRGVGVAYADLVTKWIGGWLME